jgi:putative transposase
MCQVLEVSSSGYYAWRQRPRSRRAQENDKLVKRIRQIHEDSYGTYGSPRVHAELRAEGFCCNKKRVERLMRLNGIQAQRKRRRKRTTDSNHAYPIAANLLQQDFQAERPNQKWVADITYIPTWEGWLYLAVVLDLFSRKVVGWAMDQTMEASLTLKALGMALATRRPSAELIHHSDRGSQYACSTYQDLLKNKGIQVSMSATGNCYDNAAMESFIGTLKSERVHLQDYQFRAEARTDIFAYIEGFYNRRRRHSTLGYLCPDDFELQFFNVT